MLLSKKRNLLACLLFQWTAIALFVLNIALPMNAAASSLDSAIPEEMIVRINGSSGMVMANETLKEYIETKYPDTKVTIDYQGTEEALAALKAGKIDFAAIGRPLTAEEKAGGFVAYPLSRRKIAIVVSTDNAFTRRLSSEEFARIFRGEIKDWSELGGDREPIRLLDRPEAAKVYPAFRIYPIFSEKPPELRGDTLRLEKENTEALIAELDENTLGYTVANLGVNRPKLRTLLVYDAFVTEDAAPLSKPLYYAYSKNPVNPTVRSLLGLMPLPDAEPEEESNAPITWWLLTFVGLLGLVWLWLNKQKALSLVKGAIANLPGQPPPIALTSTSTETQTPPESPPTSTDE
ncbi:MAG: substrate-binding domain-containing protein [Cyanobacteria bacterium SBLK]|nr:substrate-binding domain-containing protein [Cyanobacteria bacterium SBLK]